MKKKNSPLRVSRRVADFIDYMQEAFPVTFPKRPDAKVALKIGIRDDVVAWAATQGVPEKMAVKALRAWCQGVRYATALSVAGAPRYDLSGSIAGEVDINQAKAAKGMLNKIARLKAKRQALKPQPLQELSAA